MNHPSAPISHGTNILFYCHDTYGLGHLRRTLTLAGALRDRDPEMSQLVVTGSPVAHNFPFPDGADYVKLPSVVKTGAGEYEARSVATDFRDIRDMRGDILLSAARHFQPDALIVDHAPAGLKGEAVAALRHLKEHSPRTKLILGLRDVVDEAPRVRRAWSREGAYALMDDVYDRIFVYGHEHLYDVVREYGLSPQAAAKTRYVGFLGREPGQRSPAEIRAELGMQTDRLVVVTAGGGGDGHALFEATIDALRDRPDPITYDCLIVGGPLMGEEEQAALRARAGGGPSIHFLDFADDMTSYLAAADAVVSMGGYNSVCEILSLGKPAVIVPRVHPRKEQLLRAEALSRRDLIRMLHPDDLSPLRLLAEIEHLLTAPPAGNPAPLFGGLPRVVDELDALLHPAVPERQPELAIFPSLGWTAALAAAAASAYA